MHNAAEQPDMSVPPVGLKNSGPHILRRPSGGLTVFVDETAEYLSPPNRARRAGLLRSAGMGLLRWPPSA
jgi:hypothetical protein